MNDADKIQLQKALLADFDKTLAETIERRNKVAASIGEASIQTELETLSKSHPGIDANPLSRMKKHIEYLRTVNGGKLDVELAEPDPSTLPPWLAAQIEKARDLQRNPKHTMPSFLQTQATFKGERGLEIEVSH